MRVQNDRSVLLITLDSCRFDTFASAHAPNLKSVGPLHKAMAPGNYTYGSHASIFMGFTPGIAERVESFVNPKYGKLFKMVGGGFGPKGTEHITLQGRNIVDGFRRKEFLTIGTAAMHWFNPANETGRHLYQDFERYFFAGRHALRKQLEWIDAQLPGDDRPVFVFVNVGETHVPYYHEAAPWDIEINPCVPFSDQNDAEECRRRQRLCLEYVDRMIAPLLDVFVHGTTVVCSDHGDCWGEDGLWEHGICHPKVLEVPLLFRLGKP